MVPDHDATAQALRLLDTFAMAMSSRDLEGTVACFAPGLKTMLFGSGADERRMGEAELRAHFARDFAQSEWINLRWNSRGVAPVGDVLAVWAEGIIEAGVGGERFESMARFTAVLAGGPDGWRIVQGHLSFPAQGQKEGQSWPTSIERLVSELAAERPDFRGQAAPDGTVTLLFSDIEDSSRVIESLGDVRWLDVLKAHNAIVQQLVAAHDGFIVKSLGDGFMLAFQSARKAIRCALAMREQFAAVDGPQGFRVRMGLHTGEVLKEGDDFFGRHVTLAARVGALAQGGQILVSGLLRDLVESTGEFRFENECEVELRGLAGKYRVCEVVGLAD